MAIIHAGKNLYNTESRKFYRFLAFESILVLFLLNTSYWFINPFSIAQVLSWIVLCISLWLLIYGIIMFIKVGKPKGHIENTTVLITTGCYKFVRHPLYSSLLFLSWGVYLKNPAYPGVIFIILLTVFVYRMSIIEEKENISKFGEDYQEYMKRSKMLIPFLF